MAEISDFQEKKKKILNKKKKIRMKKRLIVFFFLFVCVGIIFTVLKAPVFNVKTIMCVGQQELTEKQITEFAGAKTGVNIFTTGVKGMKKKLADNPLIAESNVRRIFPDKIKIWVREAKPVLQIDNGTVLILADKDGKIIKTLEKAGNEEQSTVAKLDNFESASNIPGENIYKKDNVVHSTVMECVQTLTKLEILEKITLISANDLSDIRLEYDDRLSILLGDYDNMEYKLTFIKKVISENLSEYEKAILDYRGKKLYVGPKNQESIKPDIDEGSDSDEKNQVEEAEESLTQAETENNVQQIENE